MRHCALLLTAIFSRGEPMPVHYFEQLGSNFVSFVLDYIEVGSMFNRIFFLKFMPYSFILDISSYLHVIFTYGVAIRSISCFSVLFVVVVVVHVVLTKLILEDIMGRVIILRI